MNPDKEAQIRDDALMDAYRESVTSRMHDWFLRHYEDAAESTPYDSREGGFIFINGGPYDPRDILHSQFGKDHEEELINEVADELEGLDCQWVKIPTLDDIDPLCIAAEFHVHFVDAIASIKRELAAASGAGAQSFRCALLFAYTITSLEAYLSDAFLTCIKQEHFFRSFIETDPELKAEKLSVADIFKKMESLQSDAAKRIQSIVFHRLEVVQRMYKDSLGIEFPEGMRDLIPEIIRRHDIVHRGCKDKAGTRFEVSLQQVEHLVSIVEGFVARLHEKIEPLLEH